MISFFKKNLSQRFKITWACVALQECIHKWTLLTFLDEGGTYFRLTGWFWEFCVKSSNQWDGKGPRILFLPPFSCKRIENLIFIYALWVCRGNGSFIFLVFLMWCTYSNAVFPTTTTAWVGLRRRSFPFMPKEGQNISLHVSSEAA